MRKSKTGAFHFSLFNENNRAKNQRKGEIKLSEKIKFGENSKDSKFVILGISEDIGPQMNGGFPGANRGFDAFSKAIQSVQSNEFLQGDDIAILGEIAQNESFVSIEKSKGKVEELDEFVAEILNEYVSKQQKLIVIGGGHNNAYPIIQHISTSNNQPVQAINIDPHADCRTVEYRHSGNPFSVAFKNDLLKDYTVFGLHESYNNQNILDFLKAKNCHYQTFESFVVNRDASLSNFKTKISELNGNLPITLDIDLDSIAFNPSSAITPSGFSIEDIRMLIHLVGAKNEINALHLPEGSPSSEIELRMYGKMLSYFVIDFIKI